jgi:hypothetical protein
MTYYQSELTEYDRKKFFLLEGTGQLIQTLYRGQHMSASELTQLKACVGGIIAMTSFVSTSKNLDVAKMFAGNGEGTCDIESVIFEIIIDECEHEYQRSPFADIRAFSSKPEEEEVLLFPRTVLQVKSVERKGPVTWVLVHMCQCEESKVPEQFFLGMSFQRVMIPVWMRYTHCVSFT